MGWQHIQFSDGSNPYVCKTENEFLRLKEKYGNAMTQIKDGFWWVEIQKGGIR